LEKCVGNLAAEDPPPTSGAFSSRWILKNRNRRKEIWYGREEICKGARKGEENERL